MTSIRTRGTRPLSLDELRRWEAICTRAPRSKAPPGWADAMLRLVTEVATLRHDGLELLDAYRQSELDAIDFMPLSPDERDLLEAQVARYRRLFEGTTGPAPLTGG